MSNTLIIILVAFIAVEGIKTFQEDGPTKPIKKAQNEPYGLFSTLETISKYTLHRLVNSLYYKMNRKSHNFIVNVKDETRDEERMARTDGKDGPLNVLLANKPISVLGGHLLNCKLEDIVRTRYMCVQGKCLYYNQLVKVRVC